MKMNFVVDDINVYSTDPGDDILINIENFNRKDYSSLTFSQLYRIFKYIKENYSGTDRLIEEVNKDVESRSKAAEAWLL